jgi:hypothetical protein
MIQSLYSVIGLQDPLLTRSVEKADMILGQPAFLVGVHRAVLKTGTDNGRAR